jgi:cell division protein FtsQ
VSTRPPAAPPKPAGPERVSPPIDPRFRQRRIEVRRVEGRRRLRVLLILGGFVLFALAAWGATRSPFLDVDHVRVTGSARVPAAAVAAASGVGQGTAMFDVDEAAARLRVEALPWVLRARVHRRWPATVTIEVQERTPIAALPGPGGVAVVDRTGRVLTVAPTPPPELPLLVGLPPAGAPGTRIGGRAGDLLAVARAMPPAVLPRLAGIVAADAGQVELRLRPSGVVKLGLPTALGDKLLAVQTVLGQVDLTRLAVLDVRVPASPAVTRA